VFCVAWLSQWILRRWLCPDPGKKGKPGSVGFERIGEMLGTELLGKKYVPLFDYYKNLEATAFRVCNDLYVTDDRCDQVACV
jgi:hypothetical protein